MRDEVQTRIGLAWRELRRGASMGALRDLMQGEIGLDLGQLDTLEHLVHGGTTRMSELADALRVDASTATRAVQRLVDRELAERSAHPRDARCVHVAATDAGRALYDEVAATRSTAMHEILTVFTVDERRQLAEGMERLVASFDDYIAHRTAAEAP